MTASASAPWCERVCAGTEAERAAMRDNRINKRERAPDPAGEIFAKVSLDSGPTIRALEVFVAVAKTGTMVAAARQFRLTQPAISQTIAGLEQVLGIQLFDRSVRPPALTLQGTALIEHAAAITDAVKQFQSTVRLGATAPVPLLRIGMLNSFATTMGPYVLKRLRHVAAELSIDSGFQATRFRTVVDRDFDFVITADESPVPVEIKAMPILTEPFLLVVPSRYDAKQPSLQDVSEKFDLVRFGRDPNLHSRFDRVLDRHGVMAQHRYHLDTVEAVLAMVAIGSSWTILTPLAICKSVARGDPIRVLPFPGKPLHRTINVVSLRNEGLFIAKQIHSASIEALNDHFLPQLRASMPECVGLTSLHGAAAT
jgi:DNA-binding transcriptional LysR family regulator